MPCGALGARPKPGLPPWYVIGGQALLVLVTSRLPFLAQFLVQLAPYAVDTQTFCNADPPAIPQWEPTDLLSLIPVPGAAPGLGTQKLALTLHNLVWHDVCECADGSTPPPSPVAAPVAVPEFKPDTQAACETGNKDYTSPDSISVNHPFIDTWFSPMPITQGSRPLPPGATHFKFTTTLVDAAGTPTSRTINAFLRVGNAGGTASGEGGTSHSIATDVGVSKTATGTITGAATHWAATLECQPGGGPCNPGTRMRASVEFYCGDPALADPECCNDPLLLARIEDLALKINLLVRRAGPDAPLEEIRSTSISGEGILTLALGTRMINVDLSTLGPDTRTVPYANPDRIMRTGTIRFGNDFGWRRREHVDARDVLFPVPSDVTVCSWSLSPGTSGTLRELGQPL